jgi:hypothetical protein
MKSQLLIIFGILLAVQISFAQQLPLYYGNEFLSNYQEKKLPSDQLKSALFTILSGGHVKNENSGDSIYPNCASADTPSKCTEHHPLGYDTARRKLFGSIHLEVLASGEFAVTDVYCEQTFTDRDFKGEKTFGPDLVPSSGNIINTEHTWPQSRFTGRFPRNTQKSDLHHLFPTDSQMNSRRSSLRFGKVVKVVEPLKCPIAKLGHQENGEIIFEPPVRHKGNIARALFYFATRYQMKISAPEEAALREWHMEDPVDAAEYERNNQVEQLQGNRNPFIDFADLIDQIENFK